MTCTTAAKAPPAQPQPSYRSASPLRSSTRKSKMWRTAEPRPLCFNSGEADRVCRYCPSCGLGLSGFSPFSARPQRNERRQEINDYLLQQVTMPMSSICRFRSLSPRRPDASPDCFRSHAYTSLSLTAVKRLKLAASRGEAPER